MTTRNSSKSESANNRSVHLRVTLRMQLLQENNSRNQIVMASFMIFSHKSLKKLTRGSYNHKWWDVWCMEIQKYTEPNDIMRQRSTLPPHTHTPQPWPSSPSFSSDTASGDLRHLIHVYSPSRQLCSIFWLKISITHMFWPKHLDTTLFPMLFFLWQADKWKAYGKSG